MNITHFSESKYQKSLIEKIETGDWRAAKFLAKRLREGTFQQAVGGAKSFARMES